MTRTRTDPSLLPAPCLLLSLTPDFQIGPCLNQPYPDQRHNKMTGEEKTVFRVYCLGSEDSKYPWGAITDPPFGKERKWIPKWWDALQQRPVNFLCERPDHKYCRICWPSGLCPKHSKRSSMAWKWPWTVTNQTYMNEQGCFPIKLFVDT